MVLKLKMKTHHTFGIAILIILILATTLVVSAFHQPLQPAIGKTTVVLQNTVVPVPTETDSSQVGSTTGLFVMEFVILLIIIIPLIFRKKRK